MKTATLHISEVLHGNFDTKQTAMSSEKRRWSDESNQESGARTNPSNFKLRHYRTRLQVPRPMAGPDALFTSLAR